VYRDKHVTTRPIRQVMVFPDFGAGVLRSGLIPHGFLAEAKVQVSERVTGFVEKRGRNSVEHKYAPGSPWSQREVNRFFETSGVCLHAPEVSIVVAEAIARAFCTLCGVQPSDIGVGLFHARHSPLGAGDCQGVCIYDSTYGSLRLTETLATRITEVIELALVSATPGSDEATVLSALQARFRSLRTLVAHEQGSETPLLNSSWVEVIDVGERGMYVGNCQPIEVKVLAIRYTPQGLMYRLDSPEPSLCWMVASGTVQPLHGVSRTVEFNMDTGETRPIKDQTQQATQSPFSAS